MAHSESDRPPEERLYQTLAAIPRGRIIAYGQLARLAGFEGRARWAGRVLSQLPSDTQLPWHRVVSAARRISLPEGHDSYIEQKKRLINEGVHFTASGTIDKKYLFIID